MFVCRVLGVTSVTWGPWVRGRDLGDLGPWERGRDLDDLGDLEELDARSECLCVGRVAVGGGSDLDKFRKFV